MVKGAYTNYELMLHAHRICRSAHSLAEELRILRQDNHLEM